MVMGMRPITIQRVGTSIASSSSWPTLRSPASPAKARTIVLHWSASEVRLAHNMTDVPPQSAQFVNFRTVHRSQLNSMLSVTSPLA